MIALQQVDYAEITPEIARRFEMPEHEMIDQLDRWGGLIATYESRSALGQLTTWRTWSYVGHASWIRADGTCIEAWIDNGLRLKGSVRHVPHWCDGHTPGTVLHLLAWPALIGLQRERFETFLLAQVGKPYDFRGLTGFMTRPDGERLASREKWFCSELIHGASVEIAQPLLARVPSHKVPPCDLEKSPQLVFVGSVRTYERKAA